MRRPSLDLHLSLHIDRFQCNNMPSSEDRIVKMIKALADPTRIRLLQEIARRKQVTCAEVGDISDLAQPTLSHHIKLLVDSGLVNAEKDGRYVILSVNKEMTEELSKFVKDLMRTAE